MHVLVEYEVGHKYEYRGYLIWVDAKDDGTYTSCVSNLDGSYESEDNGSFDSVHEALGSQIYAIDDKEDH